MTKNRFPWTATGFSIACLSAIALTPRERTSIPVVVLVAACTVWLILFVIANTSERARLDTKGGTMNQRNRKKKSATGRIPDPEALSKIIIFYYNRIRRKKKDVFEQ